MLGGGSGGLVLEALPPHSSPVPLRVLADSKEITQRTDCERQEFIRTSVRRAGSPPTKSLQHRLSRHRVLQHMQGGCVAHTSCVRSECRLFTIPGPHPGTVSFWLFFDGAGGRAPKVPQHTYRWPSLYSHRGRGSWSLGRGLFSHPTHPL